MAASLPSGVHFHLHGVNTVTHAPGTVEDVVTALREDAARCDDHLLTDTLTAHPGGRFTVQTTRGHTYTVEARRTPPPNIQFM